MNIPLLPGAVIIKEGCRMNKFYILNEGNASIYRDGEQIGDQSAGALDRIFTECKEDNKDKMGYTEWK